LVQPTNAGRDTRDRFAVAPESEVRLGHRLTDHLEAFVGYTFLNVSSVARPGDQVDRAIDFLVSPTTHPVGGIRGTDFYAHSAQVGLGWRW
jgi:hypothetical protein